MSWLMTGWFLVGYIGSESYPILVGIRFYVRLSILSLYIAAMVKKY